MGASTMSPKDTRSSSVAAGTLPASPSVIRRTGASTSSRVRPSSQNRPTGDRATPRLVRGRRRRGPGPLCRAACWKRSSRRVRLSRVLARRPAPLERRAPLPRQRHDPRIAGRVPLPADRGGPLRAVRAPAVLRRAHDLDPAAGGDGGRSGSRARPPTPAALAAVGRRRLRLLPRARARGDPRKRESPLARARASGVAVPESSDPCGHPPGRGRRTEVLTVDAAPLLRGVREVASGAHRCGHRHSGTRRRRARAPGSHF